MGEGLRNAALFFSSLALPFKGRVGWGWCSSRRFSFSSFRREPPTSSSRRRPGSSSFLFIPAKAFPFVIPAEAGIHLLFLLTFGASRKPTHVPVVFRPPSWRPGHFLCLPRESNQREGTRVGRRRFAPVRYGRPGFCRQAIHGLRQKRRDPSRRPALARGPDPSALRRPTRAKVKSEATATANGFQLSLE